MDKLDQLVCNFPIIGKAITRLYTYFKAHTLITDFMHVCIGIGIGLFVTKQYLPAALFFTVGLIGHLIAFIQGGKS